MASCIRNIRTKNYQNLVIGFQVTVKNVGDVFLRHRVLMTNAFSASEIFLSMCSINLQLTYLLTYSGPC